MSNQQNMMSKGSKDETEALVWKNEVIWTGLDLY